MIKVKNKLPENDEDVTIENDVWISSNVTILSGVKIGGGSIIGAGSVIIKDVSPYNVVVGSLPRKIWSRWNIETIKKHKNLLTEKYKQNI